MQSINQAATAGAGAYPRPVPAPAVIAEAASAGGDPLLSLIQNYQAQLDVFNDGATDDEDGTFAAATYEPFFLALERPPAPTTVEGALAGLDFVLTELALFTSSPACKAVLGASTTFLQQQFNQVVAEQPKERFIIKAHTDRIGGSAINTIYAEEYLLCETASATAADLKDGLHVIAFSDSVTPMMVHIRRHGRDGEGRYVKPGSPSEALDLGYFICDSGSIGSDIVILGRLVDQTRVCPKPQGA